MTRDERENATVSIPTKHIVNFTPRPTHFQTSTLQKSSWQFTASKDEYGDNYYLVVTAVRRWASSEVIEQDFAIAVTLQAQEPRLYQQVQLHVQQLQQRQRSRIRV